ncbi:phospho-N-acetylmuramoyl-pentapeptide-transferase [Pseudothermotoga thermarum]|uniref:Phospho-N-acetylmuramoyl-pentapeptide-transferase n=1 Tax=Pseudothermotoga thermarum DSM 5069 TaxID=688269 RepID=F7YW86_9THEM|nr:phospho-N-acetylmuramoyl-pentapeptide-transferase [Pseudothermotoga thermarum]AEH51858.1 Phospho-N-acetylmuramoyl-pentapeptide-transferase [Pseudothermotoga thermarum DSM 5069]
MLKVLVSFIVSVSLYPFLIKAFKKWKIGQFIREEGPDLHNYKAGTPTMGGILFVTVAVVGCLFSRLYIDALALAMFGFVGFLDDFLSVRRKKALGLRAWQKFSLQVVFATVLYLLIKPESYVAISKFGKIELGGFYPIFAVLLISGFSNAVNLTDGLDGLAGTIYLITAVFYWISLKGKVDSLLYSLVAVMAFLFYNVKPAKIFMGDTGALALGGLLGTIAVRTKSEMFLIALSPIFLVEVISVIMQVTSFKLFKRRIFKMSPLHHHFELLGWKEERVVQIFALVNILFATVVLAEVYGI